MTGLVTVRVQVRVDPWFGDWLAQVKLRRQTPDLAFMRFMAQCAIHSTVIMSHQRRYVP